MIRSGDTLHNPVTGETLRFVKSAADTDGEYVLVEVVVEPRGAVAAAHVHPETMFALANDGKTNRKGLPNPLRLAVIARAHFDVVRLPFPPAWVQRMGLAMGAPLGRMLGFRPTYEAA